MTHSADFVGMKRKLQKNLLMNCDVITVTRATRFGRHQIRLEDAPRLDTLQVLDFLKRLWWTETELPQSSGRERGAQKNKKLTFLP